jgi:starch synthase
LKPTQTLSNPAFSPNYDNKIFKKFSVRTLDEKVINKMAFQQELGLVAEKKIPLICIPSGMSDDNGGKFFQEIIPGILSMECQILVRGIGSKKYGAMLTELANEYPHKIKIVKDDEVLRRKMYAACDMSLFFSRDIDEIANCLAYGAIPICFDQDEIIDFDPVQESGNSFTASSESSWSLFAAIVRACETFKLPYDWKTIQKQAMGK